MSGQCLVELSLKPDITQHSFKSLLDFLVADSQVKGQEAVDFCQLDPRDGSMIIYAEHRSLRQDEHRDEKPAIAAPCPICSGQLTHVIDYAEHSQGFTFISQNMFPVLYPKPFSHKTTSKFSLTSDPHHIGREAFGFHLLQWSSSFHDFDWHNLPFEDVHICMQRLQTLEEKLLKHSIGYMPYSNEKKHIGGYVSIIKNYGASAGASLTHGHQQIAFSNIMPQRMYNNARFFNRNHRTFSEYLWSENPENLTISAQDNCRVIVPYFMRRPFNVLIILNTQAEHLHELSNNELMNLTCAMQKTIKSFHRLLPELGREVSYNMAVHTGPDNHVYVEFFPMVQASGGFERIGLWICQLSAENTAAQLREIYQQIDLNE